MMGNLGLYQDITTISKKVGGPQNLILITAFGGYVVLRGAEAVGKKVYKTIKVKIHKKDEQSEAVYEVISEAIDSQGLSLHLGDQIRILGCDADAVLIERLGDKNSPYFVSMEFLTQVLGDEQIGKYRTFCE